MGDEGTFQNSMNPRSSLPNNYVLQSLHFRLTSNSRPTAKAIGCCNHSNGILALRHERCVASVQRVLDSNAFVGRASMHTLGTDPPPVTGTESLSIVKNAFNCNGLRNLYHRKNGLHTKFSKILLCNLCNALHCMIITYFYSLKIF